MNKDIENVLQSILKIGNNIYRRHDTIRCVHTQAVKKQTRMTENLQGDQRDELFLCLKLHVQQNFFVENVHYLKKETSPLARTA